MKKKLLGLILAAAMMLSLSVAVNASPGGGVAEYPTIGGPRTLSVTICLEDN